MSESGQFPEADGGGGRSARGPSTNVPGETEPGGVLPPHDGRQTEGDADEMTQKARSGDSDTGDGMRAPKPANTPGGSTASPADEQPAEDMPETADDDPGVDAGHVQGTPAGESGGA